MKLSRFSRLKRQKKPPMVGQVAEHLTRLIADGRLAPGEKLPGENVLAARIGVSRPTLREAIGVLRGRGLLEVRPRSGTYVAVPVTLDAIEELLAVDPRRIWELLEIRKVVDAGAASLAAQRRTGAHIVSLRETLSGLEQQEGEALLSGEQGGRIYGRFFDHLARATGNTLYVTLVESVSRMLRDAFRVSRSRLAEQPGAGRAIADQLEAIVDALERRDKEEARAAALKHLDYVEKALGEKSFSP